MTIANQLCKFQFHKGTIKPTKGSGLILCFNLFQFHKGTIKPLYRNGVGLSLIIFQFHKGTIKPLINKNTVIIT